MNAPLSFNCQNIDASGSADGSASATSGSVAVNASALSEFMVGSAQSDVAAMLTENLVIAGGSGPGFVNINICFSESGSSGHFGSGSLNGVAWGVCFEAPPDTVAFPFDFGQPFTLIASVSAFADGDLVYNDEVDLEWKIESVADSNGNQVDAVITEAAPEPATVWLLGIGALWIGCRIRRVPS